MKEPDGGSAFPMSGRNIDFFGMSLRDYFAAAALSGIAGSKMYKEITFSEAAQEAYLYAKAMIEARDEP